MWSRIHLIPVLQAEEDRDQVRRMLADKAREKELLGGETKVYHSDRYVQSPSFSQHRFPEWRKSNLTDTIRSFVRPTFAVTPLNATK